MIILTELIHVKPSGGCVAKIKLIRYERTLPHHQLNQKFTKPIPPLPDDAFFGVNRLTLREILLAGLEDTVHFGKTFARFEDLRPRYAENRT